MVNNFSKVFGHECPFMGKLLYLFMARGYDRQRISLARFVEALYPLFDNENRLHHNKIAFNLMDMDRDNVLNIMNLLHL